MFPFLPVPVGSRRSRQFDLGNAEDGPAAAEDSTEVAVTEDPNAVTVSLHILEEEFVDLRRPGTFGP